METTYAFLKQNALASFLVVAVVSANGQIWFSNTRIQGLEEEIQDLRADMLTSDQMLRAEMIKGDQAIRAEMNAGFQSIRAEMIKGDQAVRADMNAGFQSIRAEMANTNERLARVETRLTSVERILYADLDPPAP